LLSGYPFLLRRGVNSLKPWITRTRKVLLSQPPWLTVEQHEVELPDGRIIPDWPWVITPDYINVLPVTENDLFLVFRQVKYGLDGASLAVIGGYITPGEDPLSAAKRELAEETGYQATEWYDLGTYRVDPNRGIALGHLYLALGAYPSIDPVQDDLEEQELLRLTRSELSEALSEGKFQVLAWAATVVLGLNMFDQKNKDES
jgi:8-oxo-dGTP pyrophosphatase MutT (NUDIX family)